MVFSNEEKAVIKNDFNEKQWSAYRICKEHPTKNWNKVSVQRLLNRFKENGSMDRKSGSGRPRTATTAENEEIVEDLICSQEESPGSHMSPREIEKHTGISRSSMRRMVKRKDIERIMKRRDWMFIQDSAPSHPSNLVQEFLTEKNDKRFIKHNE